MQQYIGTKIINAKPMTRGEYNDWRGWKLPENENGADEGYLVEYTDGGEPNMPAHFKGYVSWSPKDVFENAYRKTDGLSFGLALEALKMGKKVARKGWNGKGMWLIYVPRTAHRQLGKGTPYELALNNEHQAQSHVTIDGHIDMYTSAGTMQPGWLASQSDMLSDDWEIVT